MTHLQLHIIIVSLYLTCPGTWNVFNAKISVKQQLMYKGVVMSVEEQLRLVRSISLIVGDNHYGCHLTSFSHEWHHQLLLPSRVCVSAAIWLPDIHSALKLRRTDCWAAEEASRVVSDNVPQIPRAGAPIKAGHAEFGPVVGSQLINPSVVNSFFCMWGLQQTIFCILQHKS